MNLTHYDIYMHRCIELAKKGLGYVAPNPLVGAVLVNRGIIIGEGYHRQYGAAHAEVNAIENIVSEINDETILFVNLEPCDHYGKTGPCTELILSKGIKTVVIGTEDPFMNRAGKGIEKLENNGVKVISGICRNECIELNKRFFTAIEKKRPYIILKYAQTIDGFIGFDFSDGNNSDRPAQISNEFSQRLTHKWRAEETGILVGKNTALMDNPQLNARHYGNNNPIRIVFDKDLKIPRTFHLLDDQQKTIIFTSKEMFSLSENLSYIRLDFTSENFLKEVLKSLLCLNIQSILIEGGMFTLQQFINAELWDEARIFTSPLTFGEGTRSPVLSHGIELISEETIEKDRLTIYKNKNACSL